MSLRTFRHIPKSLAEWARWCEAQDTLKASDLDTYISTDTIKSGTGSPEGKVIANKGTLYLRTDGAASTTLYVKTSDNGSAYGWTAK